MKHLSQLYHKSAINEEFRGHLIPSPSIFSLINGPQRNVNPYKIYLPLIRCILYICIVIPNSTTATRLALLSTRQVALPITLTWEVALPKWMVVAGIFWGWLAKEERDMERGKKG